MKKALDLEIDECIAFMGTLSPDTKEYKNAAESLKLLREAAAIRMPNSVTAESLLAVFANILSIGIIVSYEQLHPLTSKALSFLKR